MYKRLFAGAVSLVLAISCMALPESALTDIISKAFISVNAEVTDDSSDVINNGDTSDEDEDSSEIKNDAEESSNVAESSEEVSDSEENSSADDSSKPENSAADSSNADSKYKVSGDFEYTAVDSKSVSIVDYFGTSENVVIPSKLDGKIVTAIGNYAFADSNMKTVTIANTVSKMGEGAFYNCGKLTKFTTASSSKLSNVAKLAFYKCLSLSKVTLPATVTVIDDYAFYGTALSSIALSAKLTRIGELAFADCPKLVAVSIPNSVTKIGNLALGYTFKYFDNQKNVDHYDAVKGFKINCYYKSQGQKYAENNGFTFSLSNPGFQVTGFKVASRKMNTIDLTWNKIAGANGYIVYRFNNKTNSWQRIARSRINVTTYPAKKLTAGTTYKFAIKAYKIINGKDITSTTLPVVTTSTAPCAVTDFKVAATSSNAIKLEWAKDSTAKGFIVYQAINSKWTRIATTTKNAYLVQNLKSGTEYRFAVKSFATENGVTATSKKFPALTAVTNMPDVTGFKVTATGGSAIKLACNKIDGATGYVFYRASAGKWVRVGVTKTNTFTDSELKSGTSYRYAVKAYKTVRGKNYYSKYFPTLWTSTNPAMVDFMLTAGENQVTAQWTNVSGATGYIVYTKGNATDAWQRATVTTDTSYTITDLETDSTIFITVKAYRTANGKTYNGIFTEKSVKVE